MGISRDSRHKRRATGGRRNVHIKKRKYEMGRPSSNTKLGAKKVTTVRTMGGNKKFRALRLETGNFSWGTESCTRRTRIVDVMYNASSNELVRTKTLVKNCIIAIDATPFKQFYEQHYGVVLGKKGEEPAKRSKTVAKKLAARLAANPILENLGSQFDQGRILACVSSRPGQSGRCDGYILEGKELDFYLRKMRK